MKSGKAILVTGIIGAVGIFGYLYLKNNKKDNAVNSDSQSGGDGISGLTNTTYTEIGNNTTADGKSLINPDPLSTSEQKIANAVVEQIKKEENIITTEQQKEADEYLLKQAKIDKAKIISTQIESYIAQKNALGTTMYGFDSTNKIKILMLDSKIASAKKELKELGYIYVQGRGIQPI